MANVVNQILHRKNSSGDYDTVYLKANLTNVTGTLAVANGGTGATDAANARTNLGAAASSHAHGNITSGGAITATAVALASGDSLVFVDSSNSSKLVKSTITFDGSTATQALTKKGTWATFNNYSHPTTKQCDAAAGNHNHSGVYIPVTDKGAASGVASLGSDGKVPSSQLPTTSGAEVYSKTLTTAGWTQGSDDRYYQTINVTGVTTDIAQLITVDVNLMNTDIDEKIAIITAWNGPAANECVQGNGTLTFYSYEEPAVDIPIYVGVH